jgi:hypothetical protein
MIIPYQSLAAETLQAIIEEFILREGTDYGDQEFSLAEKIAAVREQLNNGSILLVYSELHQNVNLIPANQFKQR